MVKEKFHEKKYKLCGMFASLDMIRIVIKENYKILPTLFFCNGNLTYF